MSSVRHCPPATFGQASRNVQRHHDEETQRHPHAVALSDDARAGQSLASENFTLSLRSPRTVCASHCYCSVAIIGAILAFLAFQRPRTPISEEQQ